MTTGSRDTDTTTSSRKDTTMNTSDQRVKCTTGRCQYRTTYTTNADGICDRHPKQARREQLHIVRYTTQSGDTYLASDPSDWSAAIARWEELDGRRRDGQFGWVRHFEVRAANDPSNPTLKVTPRAHRPKRRGGDGLDYLQHRGVTLVEGQSVYTFQCTNCGKVFQGSGLGLGSHRRGCKG